MAAHALHPSIKRQKHAQSRRSWAKQPNPTSRPHVHWQNLFQRCAAATSEGYMCTPLPVPTHVCTMSTHHTTQTHWRERENAGQESS